MTEEAVVIRRALDRARSGLTTLAARAHSAPRPARSRAGLIVVSAAVLLSTVGYAVTTQGATGEQRPSRPPRLVVAGLAAPYEQDTTIAPLTPDATAASSVPTSDPLQAADQWRVQELELNSVLSQYLVQPGDSLWTIAAQFKLSIATLVWANDLTDPTALHVGQWLVIPPMDGLVYTVKDGDSLDSLAARFGLTKDSIIRANKLPAPVIEVGQTLMLPGAQGAPLATPTPRATPKPAAPAVAPKVVTPKVVTPKVVVVNPAPAVGTTTAGARWGLSRTYNSFAVGYCTWGAAEMFHAATGVYPGWSGNAWAWAGNAAAAGWTVQSTPAVSSVIVFPAWDQGAGGLGHVAWVTSVNFSTRSIGIKEMNGPAGWNRWDYRTVRFDSGLRFILVP